jgi:hypothetical protein
MVHAIAFTSETNLRRAGGDREYDGSLGRGAEVAF